MIETTDINNAAERRDIITKYGMLEQAYGEITFLLAGNIGEKYPWQQDHLAGRQELLLELININMERPVQEAPDTKVTLEAWRVPEMVRNQEQAGEPSREVRCEKGIKQEACASEYYAFWQFFMSEGCVPGSGSGRNTEIFRSV